MDLSRLKVIDKIIPEPLGGAHRDYSRMAEILKEEILQALAELEVLSCEELVEKRQKKFRRMGEYMGEGRSG
jgi:acetyl-CoA carboxylase carboxyl transferase subunit alpha